MKRHNCDKKTRSHSISNPVTFAINFVSILLLIPYQQIFDKLSLLLIKLVVQ